MSVDARKPIPLRDLDLHLSAVFSENEAPILVRGARVRGRPFDVMRIRDITANTVQILLGRTAPADKGFGEPNKDWASIWSPVLVAAGILAPMIDSIRLQDLLHEKRRIRLCCDTNALAGGVLSWLQIVLDGCADVVTSAVVDRELAAWPERDATGGRDFWGARTLGGWGRRTQYRLARRFIEAPPPRVVVERLSPEQGALVLAKFRDETSGKSPDADVLLVELARSLVRDQPRNARVVFLTGDRNNARTATGALGPENVLFAAADDTRTREAIRGQICAARGWWSPDVGLGSVGQPAISHLLWSLMAACDVLELHSGNHIVSLENHSDVPRGAPSDWADPWLMFTRAHRPNTPPASVRPPPPPASTPPPPPPTSTPPPSRTGSPPNAPPNDEHGGWLLFPQPVRPLLGDASPSWRTNPTVFFIELLRLLGRIPIQDAVDQRYKEVRRILTALDVRDSDGNAGPRLKAYGDAWDQNDHDFFHAELLALPGYRNAIEALGGEGALGERQRDQIAMARALGQVARFERRRPWVRGDAPIRLSALTEALMRWLPEKDSTLACAELAFHASNELGLTPFRFERAMILLWEKDPTQPFEGRSGGSVEDGFAEMVISMGTNKVEFMPVDPHQLRFGRAAPVRFITRTR